MTYSKKSIRAIIRNPNDGKINWKAVRRGMIRLFSFQTQHERRDETTRYLNNIGFSAADAKVGSMIASKLIKKESLEKDEWFRAYKICMKYSGQLANYANKH